MADWTTPSSLPVRPWPAERAPVGAAELEVAVLDRTNGRRAFRRVLEAEVAEAARQRPAGTAAGAAGDESPTRWKRCWRRRRRPAPAGQGRRALRKLAGAAVPEVSGGYQGLTLVLLATA